MENHSGIFGIEGRGKACVLVILYIIKSTRNDVQKGIRKTRELGSPRRKNDSKWGGPYFAQPKAKTNRVRFLGDFRNFNRQLKRNTYPIPTIREMILNLEGFQYDISLDLSMGYYHICISKQDSNLCTIISP